MEKSKTYKTLKLFIEDLENIKDNAVGFYYIEDKNMYIEQKDVKAYIILKNIAQKNFEETLNNFKQNINE